MDHSMRSPLIEADELAAALAAGRPPVLLDIRWALGGPPGAEEYAKGHLPGAHFLDLDRDLADPPGPRGRHPLPDVGRLGEALRRTGVSADRDVVVYDAGPATSAARAWWLLRWAGHARVRVLNGGLAAWTAAGHPVTTDVPEVGGGDFRPAPGALPVVDADQAAALARTGVLLDARAGERYRGEVEPVDPKAGHIPGALSAPTTENVGPDARFLPVTELAERFERIAPGLKDRQVAVYCGSGVTASHQLLALELAGIDAALYPGSWSEWSADPRRDVATVPPYGRRPRMPRS